jgi:hypothetical protein
MRGQADRTEKLSTWAIETGNFFATFMAIDSLANDLDLLFQAFALAGGVGAGIFPLAYSSTANTTAPIVPESNPQYHK